MERCTFCEIYKHKKESIFYDGKYFFAQFDCVPVSPGHAEVIPKRHVVSLSDLSQEEWTTLLVDIEGVIKKIEKTDLKEFYGKMLENPPIPQTTKFLERILSLPYLNKKPDAYNIGWNEGRAAGRTIDHLHLHIIPRYEGDVEDPIGGIRNIIPGMGNYKK